MGHSPKSDSAECCSFRLKPGLSPAGCSVVFHFSPGAARAGGALPPALRSAPRASWERSVSPGEIFPGSLAQSPKFDGEASDSSGST